MKEKKFYFLKGVSSSDTATQSMKIEQLIYSYFS